MMTFQAASDATVQFYAVGTQAVKAGTLETFVHEDSEAGYQAILDQGFDLLDVPDPGLYLWAYWLAMRHPKVVATIWQNLPWQMRGPAWGEALARAALVVARSPLTQAALAEVGVPPAKIVLVPAAVDMEFFRPGLKNGDMVLFPGRVAEEKGILDLITASRGQPWRLIVAGDGPALAYCHGLVQSWGIDNVTFLGAVPHQDMPPLYAIANVVAYPSLPSAAWQEQFGISILEAAAAGCNLVLSRQSVFEWLGACLRGVWFANPGDFVGLRQAIGRACQMPCRQEHVGWFGVQRFDSRYIGKDLRELYGRLVSV